MGRREVCVKIGVVSDDIFPGIQTEHLEQQ